MKTTPSISLCLIIGVIATQQTFATNGMNLEGYGPIALGMGGTAIASDDTTAAVMNNPATLSLQKTENQFNFAFGILGPDVTISSPGGKQTYNSNADAFFMPAFGYIRKKNNLSYGLAMFGQGGMGTHYSSESSLSAGSGKEVHSCVSVGRVIIPLSYQISKQLSIAATLDFVWAGMSLEMPMSGAQFADLTTPEMQHSGTASGSLMNSMMPFMMAGYGLDWAHFSFNSDTQLTGEALGIGYAAKLGMLYVVNDKLNIGLTYHTQTRLSDLETENATMSFQMSTQNPPPGYPPVFPAMLTGDIAVVDFEWPSVYGMGISYKVTDKLKLSLDIKSIQWSDVMEGFTMKFTTNQDPGNDMSSMGGSNMQGQDLVASLYQYWDNQLVISVGGEYLLNENIALRLGLNHGNNPIPDQYLNPLFPATVENHLTGGFSVNVSDRSRLDFAASIGFRKEASIPTPMGEMVSAHRQFNAQMMYSFNW